MQQSTQRSLLRFYIGNKHNMKTLSKTLLAGLCMGATWLQAEASDLTDVNYVTSMGQSLSVGWTAVPVVSNKQPYNHVMFPGGIRPYETTHDRSQFVPLVEAPSPDNHRGETPVAGTAEFLTHFLAQDPKSAQLAERVQVLGSANGIGGCSITALVRGTDPYKWTLEDATQGKKLAEAEKKTFSMPGFIWTQGETDQMNKKDAAWYEKLMVDLIKDLNKDVKKITKQKNDLYCFGYQVASHLNYYPYNPTDYPTIALAQLDMALNPETRYVMTTPMYHFPYAKDGVHLTAASSKWYGAYIAYVMKKTIVDGERWLPVHPVKHIVRKNKDKWDIFMLFYVPVEPLVLDVQTVVDPGNCGFSVVGADGKPRSISSVALKGAKTVCITVDENPQGCFVRYGMTLNKQIRLNERVPSGPQTGARGCLRDSQGESVQVGIQGKPCRLDNWCPFFEYSLAEGRLVVR